MYHSLHYHVWHGHPASSPDGWAGYNNYQNLLQISEQVFYYQKLTDFSGKYVEISMYDLASTMKPFYNNQSTEEST